MPSQLTASFCISLRLACKEKYQKQDEENFTTLYVLYPELPSNTKDTPILLLMLHQETKHFSSLGSHFYKKKEFQ